MFDGLPGGWETTTLGAIATLGGGTTPSKGEESYWKNGAVPWATPTDITSLPTGCDRISKTEIEVSERALAECSLTVNPPGTVLMTSRATIGYAAINDVPMTTNQGFINFRCGERADPQFLLHWLMAKREFLVAAAGGSTFKELSRGTAKLLPILLPPLDEQRRIAKVLRSVDDTIGRQKAALVQAQKTHRLLVDATFHPYLEEQSAADMSPALLSDCCDRITYGFTNPMPSEETGPWMITALNVKDGKIDYDSARHTSINAYTSLLTDKSRPSVGSVLVTKDGTLGRVAIVDRPDICVNQSVAVLTPNRGRIISEFLSYLLQSSIGQQKMLADAGGGSVKHIYITKLADLKLCVPSLETQIECAKQAARSLSVMNSFNQYLAALLTLREGLSDDLLSGRVRVPA